MQGGCHPEKEPEEQIFLHLCTDRHADLRKMRAGVPESHLGEKREKESCLEMQQPADQRSEEMRGIRNTEENALNRAVMEAIHRITSDDMEFMENFRQNIIHVIGNYSTAKESGNTKKR